MYAPKTSPSVHVASALARQLEACGLFRCEYIVSMLGHQRVTGNVAGEVPRGSRRRSLDRTEAQAAGIGFSIPRSNPGHQNGQALTERRPKVRRVTGQLFPACPGCPPEDPLPFDLSLGLPDVAEVVALGDGDDHGQPAASSFPSVTRPRS
jgi:hypothetical protein